MSSDHLTILERLRDEEAGWDNPEFVAALDAGIAALTRESAAHGTPTTCGDTCDCGYENKLNGQCSCGYVHEQPSTPDPRDQGETVMTQQELQAAVRRALAIFDQRVDVTGDMWSDSSYYTEMSECIEDAVHCGAQAATGDYQRLPDEAVIVPQVRVRIVAGELTQDGYTPCDRRRSEQIPAQQAETVEQEVTAYLVQGGFFNPEMAQHNNVRDLLMRCRDVLAALRAAVSGEGTWQPIAAAPKDADLLLLCGPLDGVRSGYWDDDSHQWMSVETKGLTGGWMTPTLWQPMPAAPQEDSQ